MAVMERTGGPRTESSTDTRLAELARGLTELTIAASEYATAIPQVERGFRELSEMARAQGNLRLHRISKAFAAILARGDRNPECDIPFILDTAASFLETHGAKCGWTAMGTRK